MMDFTRKMMDFTLKMMDFTLKMVDFTLKMMDFTLKMPDFTLKMMGSSAGGAALEGELEHGGVSYRYLVDLQGKLRLLE